MSTGCIINLKLQCNKLGTLPYIRYMFYTIWKFRFTFVFLHTSEYLSTKNRELDVKAIDKSLFELENRFLFSFIDSSKVNYHLVTPPSTTMSDPVQ